MAKCRVVSAEDSASEISPGQLQNDPVNLELVCYPEGRMYNHGIQGTWEN